MAFITDKGFVDIPSITEKSPPNPLLGYDGCRTASPSSVASSDYMSQSTLTHRVLLYDQRCLVTGGVSDQLQACHLVSTIHMDESNRQEKSNLKKRVETILTRQQFGIGDFFLDSLPNCIALEPQLRGTLDKYGSFCITVPFDHLIEIIKELAWSNADWERRAASDPQAQRNLDMQADPFLLKKCVLLVLRPELFLPENRPLMINTRRIFRNPGFPLTESSGTWTQCYLQPDSPCLIDSSGQPYAEFDYESKRPREQRPSIFSLLVNANSKLQPAKQRRCKYDEAIHYATFVELAVKNIFFVPSGPQHDINNDSEFDDSEHESEEDSEEDEPNMINGLTFPEMENVLQRVSDGTISPEERAEAAMLMLGMAGGRNRGRPHALSPLIEDYI